MESSTVFDRIGLPAVDVETIVVQSLYESLQQVTDLRKARGRRYEAALVLVLVMLAKLSGVRSMLGVADWVEFRCEWLRTVLPWSRPHFPCANTYTYVCDHIDVNELNEKLGEFFARLCAPVPEPKVSNAPESQVVEEMAPTQTLRGQEHWALDGKSLRGSRRVREAGAHDAQFVLGLYNVSHRYMMRQVAIGGKGQERATGLQLISQLDLTGKLVSADALHTQPKWCHQILAQNGDYLIIAKGNQSTLRSDIALLFSEEPRPWLPEAQVTQTGKAHGRLEVRQMRVSSELSSYLAPTWPGVQQVFQLERRIVRQGVQSTEWVYGMTSLPVSLLSPLALLQAVREHWHIENRSHWRRDVTLGEDACKVAQGQVPQVLAALNNIVLAIIDFLDVPNAARQLRRFDASPADALALLMDPW